jgi:hypothetical protein
MSIRQDNVILRRSGGEGKAGGGTCCERFGGKGA